MERRETLRVTGARHLKCHHAVVRRKGKRPVRSGGGAEWHERRGLGAKGDRPRPRRKG
jgi:hypothetical protein